MFKLALKSITGRKKDSLLLLSVLFLSFLFSIFTSTLYSNSERAKKIERESLYGKWQYAEYNKPESKEEIKDLPEGGFLGKNRIIGRSKGFGLIGSFNEDFLRIAELNILEGRMPTAVDEVAIEQNQLGGFEKTPKIGDEIIADTVVSVLDLELNMEPEEVYKEMKKAAANEAEASINKLDSELKKIIFGLYSGQEEFKDDFIKFVSVVKGSKISRHELEHYEDTILIPSGEDLEFTYSLDIRQLVNERTKNWTHKKTNELFKKYNNILISKLTGEKSLNSEDYTIKGNSKIKYKNSYIVRRTLKVTGIYNTISNVWTATKGSVPTALITEETAYKYLENGLFKTKIAEGEKFIVKNNIFHANSNYDGQSDKPEGITLNTLAYPPGFSTDTILAVSILVFIFVITLFGVFQIYMSQLNKRLRRLALLKAIGAGEKKTRLMLIYELFIMVGITLIPALIIGVFGAKALTLGFSRNLPKFSFIVDPYLLGASILFGIIAVIAGVLYPLSKVKNVSLTGAISVKRNKAAANLSKPRKVTGKEITSTREVLSHHRSYMKKQTMLAKLVYTIIYSTMLLSLLLSFLAFTNYRDGVAGVNMPDFEIKLDYALHPKEFLAYQEELKSIGNFAEVQNIISRKGGQLSALTNKEDPLYKDTLRMIPDGVYEDLFVSKRESSKYPTFFKPESRKVNIYGIEPSSDIYSKLNSMLNGILDNPSFKNGTGIVLLYPSWLKIGESMKVSDEQVKAISQNKLIRQLFNASGSYEISYDFRKSKMMSKLPKADSPEFIEITFNSEENSEVEKNILPPETRLLKVLSTVSSFPEFGIWPFSDGLEHPTVIGAITLVRSLTTNLRSIDQMLGNPPSKTLTPSRYGVLETSIWAGRDKSSEHFVKIQQIANKYGGTAVNLYTDKEVRFNSALRISSIVILLAALIGLTALQIQLNISKARVDTEKAFVGTLQALGIGKGHLIKDYVLSGLKLSIIATIIAHLIFLGVLIVHILTKYSVVVAKTGMINLLIGELWLYPWSEHLIITGVFLIVGTLIYYLPFRRVLATEPINNIRV